MGIVHFGSRNPNWRGGTSLSKICSCGKRITHKGLRCLSCAQRHRQAKNWETRFWAKVEPEPNSGCWLWIGKRDRNNYGRMSWPWKGQVLAHRVAYILASGPIPDGLELDHLCRLPPCVNPSHLQAVSHSVNMERGIWPRRTHCVHGHPFHGDNLSVLPDGERVCRICNRRRNAEYHRRKLVPR